MNAQEKKTTAIVNPAGKWFFGAEIGPNIITSYNFNEPNKSLQGGVLAEFYTGRHWSLTGRFKYFETGVSFLNTKDNFKSYNRAVISIPVNIKCKINLDEKSVFYIKNGLAYNYGLTSNNYSEYCLVEDEAKSFVSFNYGIGFEYYTSSNNILFIDLEHYVFGDYKGNNGGFFLPKNYYAENILINFGIKHNFKL